MACEFAKGLDVYTKKQECFSPGSGGELARISHRVTTATAQFGALTGGGRFAGLPGLILLIGALLSGCDVSGMEGGIRGRVLDPNTQVLADSSVETPPVDAARQHLLDLINEARAQGRTCGEFGFMPAAPPLTWNSLLEASAKLTVEEMASGNYFAHTNPFNGDNGGDRIASVGYNFIQWGENLDAGYTTPEAAMKALLASPTHCRIIMRPYWREVAWYRRETPEHSTYKVLGAQHFGLRQ